ncbi:hypothetical protein GF358_04710 [Candidatus Woesearchaeota archaeon]|nr:hypothetical protein [Candidatus Woesearchaeota archaeon]
MKKILFALAVLLLLAACAVQQPAAPAQPSTPAEPEPTVMEQETYVPEEPETVEESMPEKRQRLAEHQSSELYQAFEKGMQLCNYKIDDVLIRAWILNMDRFRIETAVPGTRVSTVYDEEMVHSWDDRTKMGVKMKIEDLPEKEGERVAGIEIPRTPEKVMTSDVDVVCVKSTAIGEDILDVPDNVDFTDLTGVVEE